MSQQPSRADVCVVACAEAFRGDGEVLASGMGVIPRLGVSLARCTFEPDLLVTDGEATLVAEPVPVGPRDGYVVRAEGQMPFRRVFDQLWGGRRHVMMGAAQIDRHGATNISCIGEWAHPKAQLLGVRGAPGNTVNNRTSYFVPNHSLRTFVERVDVVSGVGYDRERWPTDGLPFLELGHVVTDLAVLDHLGNDGRMRLRSVHPGVTVEQVVESTGFELEVPDEVPTSRLPTDDELRLLDEVLDPHGIRHGQVA